MYGQVSWDNQEKILQNSIQNKKIIIIVFIKRKEFELHLINNTFNINKYYKS